MGIFDEIFRPPRIYEPPSAAAEALQDVALGRPLRVLDLGANVGLFAVYVLAHYPGAEVTSYEPEPANFRVLTHCASRNVVAKWDIVQACAMTNSDKVRITPGRFGHSHVSNSGVEVPGVDVLPLLVGYDFVKMDMEGSEWPILRDERWPHVMRDVAAFALEWHRRGCSAQDPREEAVAAVEAAGFSYAASPSEWDHGMMWGWR